MWRPLRIQLHYFDYLNDPHRADAWKKATVDAWIERDFPKTSDAWTAYPASLRIVNWIKLFTRLPPDEVEAKWLAGLYDQALWLENNLERHILANHYLKNAKALLFAGMFFSGTDADRWREAGLRLFLSEMDEQFLIDGGHYERSPMYHAISLEDLLDVATYLRSGAYPAAADTLERLRAKALAGLDFMTALLLPDGTLPLFNDSAHGVGPSPAELYAYARTTFGYEPAPARAGLALRALSASGYYVIREGSDALVIDCGALGPPYQPGHGHCDLLSYELVLHGRRIVVDTGVFDYEPNERRRYARGTAAHNTVQVDGAEQSEVWDVFRVGRRAVPGAANLMLAGEREATFVGSHDGYMRSPLETLHTRSLRFDRGRWFFEDRLDGRGRHLIESRVHLHPDLRVRQTDDVLAISAADGEPLATLRASCEASVRTESKPYFSCFGTSRERSVIVLSLETTLPAKITYEIWPDEVALDIVTLS